MPLSAARMFCGQTDLVRSRHGTAFQIVPSKRPPPLPCRLCMPPDPKSATDEATVFPLVGAGVNASLAVLKILAGTFGNSYALIADGIESTADIVSSLIVWGGLVVASRPPDEKHP